QAGGRETVKRSRMSRWLRRFGSGRFALVGALGLSCLSMPALTAAPAPPAGALPVVGLRTEYKEKPLGVGSPPPRLSWLIQSAGRGVVQSAYEVRVAGSEGALRSGHDLVWTSGRVASDESTQRPYAGPALRSGDRLYWQVRVWDGGGRASAWS